MTPDPIAIDPTLADQNSAASERQTSRWDIHNAPKNYISLVTFQVASAVCSFSSVWLITHYFGSEDYGGVIAIVAASQVAQVLVNWTSVAVVRFGVDEFIETGQIARTFWIRLIILLINVGLVLAFSRFWFPPLANWLKLSSDAFWLVILHFAVTVLWIHFQMSLQGAKLPRVQGMMQMTERLVIFFSLLLFLIAGRLEFVGIVLSYVLGPGLMIVYGLFRLRNYVFARFSVDRDFLWSLVTYSVPLAPMSLVGYFSGSYLDAIFIASYLSKSELGIYSVATQLNGIVLQLPTLANALLLPLFITLQNENQAARTRGFFKDLLPSVVLIWGIGCSVIASIGGFLIPVVFGIDFGNASSALWILLAASATALPVLLGYSALAQAQSQSYILMIAAVCASLANVVFDVALIPQYGIKGCAWATVVACFTGSLVYGLLLRRVAEISLSWVFLAMLPALVGAAVFSQTDRAELAILSCATTAIPIAYFYGSSISAAITLVRRLRT